MLLNLSKLIKKLVYISLLFILGSWISPAPSSISINHCQVYGSIFITSTIGNADVVVYLEEEESFSDLVVFKEDSPSLSTELGHWFITKEPQFAKYRVFITENQSEADFTIYFTDVESFAGCN